MCACVCVCVCPQNVLGNLYSLTSLQQENLNGLNDDYVRGLASLTGLTSLGVLAVSNHAVTNASLGELSTLTELRKLTWHVGELACTTHMEWTSCQQTRVSELLTLRAAYAKDL